jgi:CRP-like cAMP-binding protein
MTKQISVFNPKTFLSTTGAGRDMMSFRRGQVIFAQGDASDAVFVIQTGRVRLSRRSHTGKEATLDIWALRTLSAKTRLRESLSAQRLRAR